MNFETDIQELCIEWKSGEWRPVPVLELTRSKTKRGGANVSAVSNLVVGWDGLDAKAVKNQRLQQNRW